PPSSTLFPYTTLFRSCIVARSPGIDGIQPVSQAFFHQEVESPINGGRCCTGLIVAHQLQQFVCLHAAPLLQEDFQHPAPQGRERSEEHTSELQSRENL